MPHDLTPDPDGNQTPIAPDGSDPLTAASAEAFLQRLADRDANIAQAVSAWLSMGDVATALGDPFTLILKSSYPSGDWTMIGTDDGIEVPSAGLYRIDFVSLMDAADDTSYLEVEAEVGVAVGATSVGFFQGFRYGDNAAPAQIVGWIKVAISDPATQRLFFSPVNGTTQTPQTETSVGRLHKILISRLGDI